MAHSANSRATWQEHVARLRTHVAHSNFKLAGEYEAAFYDWMLTAKGSGDFSNPPEPPWRFDLRIDHESDSLKRVVITFQARPPNSIIEDDT